MVSTELSRDPLDVVEAMRLVDLEDRLDRFPSPLSGGEQRVFTEKVPSTAKEIQVRKFIFRGLWPGG